MRRDWIAIVTLLVAAFVAGAYVMHLTSPQRVFVITGIGTRIEHATTDGRDYHIGGPPATLTRM
jgi:hypothetical protein